MFTLHLSRFLRGPPSPTLQRINAWVHREPYDSVIYCLYWFFVLIFFVPMVGMALPWILLYELVMRALRTNIRILPKQSSTNGAPRIQLAVVITGCDSGIGKELALYLASEGFVVFAGCLKKESFVQLSGMESSIYPIVLDVTNNEQVTSCRETVQKWLDDGGVDEERYLHAVINNAGIGVPGYFDWLDLRDFELCMNVNCYGPIRMTKAFLPILKKQSISGRHQYSQIINVISVAGMISGTGLSASCYETSKHAIEAFTNALRLEMKMFGIRVVALNPSFFDTPMTNNVRETFRETVLSKISPEVKEEYGEAFIDAYVEHCDKLVTSGRWNLEVLIDSVVRVVRSKDPPAQLMIGMDRYGHATFQMLPQWARHLFIQLGLPPQTPAVLAKKWQGNG